MKQCQITTVYSSAENAMEARNIILDSFLAFLRKELKAKDIFAAGSEH